MGRAPVARWEVERKLAAILAADVVGYSRLMEADEAGTLAAMKAHRRELWTPMTEKHGGRIVGTAGDSLLVEFPSVVAAVECAVEVQSVMAERNADLADDLKMLYRVGINLGDVLVDGDDIYGDGVNVAARLEELADPGGICISSTVFDHVKGKVDLDFAKLGEQKVKNISEPLRVYRVLLETNEGTAYGEVAPPDQATESETIFVEEGTGEAVIGIDLSLPDKPSIAVLPFNNMSAEPDQEFFSDGITEDIITALSKIASLLVVARSSTFTYKGRAIDVKEVSREQGVRYVLEGSVRKSGNRVRVTAQLIDATTGHHLWAERYDRDLEDIFAVQDEITREVVLALNIRLSQGEQARIWSGGTKNLEAWERTRLGTEKLKLITRESVSEARRLFGEALDLDASYAVAWALLGWTYWQAADGYVKLETDEAREDALKGAEESAQKAIELDPSCADAYALIGMCHLSRGLHDRAVAMTEKSIALAPNHAFLIAICAIILNKSGQPRKSVELIKTAMRLCPIYPTWFLYVLGTACRLAGWNDSAVRRQAVAWALLGWTYWQAADGYVKLETDEAREDALKGAEESAQKAIELDPSCADAYALIGMCHLSRGLHDRAVAMTEKSIALAPNHAFLIAICAIILNKSGQPRKSVELIKTAMRLCPIYPTWFLYVLGTACRLAGWNDSAVSAYEEQVRRDPSSLTPRVCLASAFGETGHEEKARKSAAEVSRINPDFSIGKYVDGLSYWDPTESARFEDGLRKAGLPE